MKTIITLAVFLSVAFAQNGYYTTRIYNTTDCTGPSVFSFASLGICDNYEQYWCGRNNASVSMWEYAGWPAPGCTGKFKVFNYPLGECNTMEEVFTACGLDDPKAIMNSEPGIWSLGCDLQNGFHYDEGICYGDMVDGFNKYYYENGRIAVYSCQDLNCNTCQKSMYTVGVCDGHSMYAYVSSHAKNGKIIVQ